MYIHICIYTYVYMYMYISRLETASACDRLQSAQLTTINSGVCEKKVPPEKRTRGKLSFRTPNQGWHVRIMVFCASGLHGQSVHTCSIM